MGADGHEHITDAALLLACSCEGIGELGFVESFLFDLDKEEDICPRLGTPLPGNEIPLFAMSRTSATIFPTSTGT